MNVAIIGASGYTGLELIKIIHAHKHFTLHTVATTAGDMMVEELHPALKSVVLQDVKRLDIDAIGRSCGVVFLAVPHKSAMELVKPLMAYACKIVDLSADYRLELAAYEKHYCVHSDKEHINEAVYGLPELYKEQIKEAKLVANPGCYPTASILALAPFAPYIKEGSTLIVDAKSGVSGAGKKLSDTTHFVHVNENIFAYSPLEHRHAPEIAEKIAYITDKTFDVEFVPHLIPVTRGMLCSVYMELEEEMDAKKLLEDFYKEAFFVRLKDKPVEIKEVAGTNFCDIYVKQKGRRLFLSSAIDNLLRGASSQAVVNANLMCGFDEAASIPVLAYAP